MQFDKEKLQLRLYQQTILNTAAKSNTLVVLPTGLGKTHIAIALSGLYFERGKVLMMAPTVPLVNQHYEVYKQFFSPQDGIVMLNGKIPAEERIRLWKSARIVLATPQTIRFDVIAGRIKLDDVSLVIFDEAHRAVGDYAYVFIGKVCGRMEKPARTLALTASPGTQDVANEICENLRIEKVEARDRDHEEVVQYVQPIHTNYVLLDLPQNILEIKKRLDEAIAVRLRQLQRLGIPLPPKVSRKTLITLNYNLRKRFLKDKRYGLGLSVCTALIKLQHAHALLTTESLNAVQRYFSQVWESAKTNKAKSIRDIINDMHVKLAYSATTIALETGSEHPKLGAAKDAVEKLLRENPYAKILLFTEFRDNVPVIINTLSKIREASISKFIGQASRAEKGMSQKSQAEVLEQFRRGELNVLVCTSVGEEGIDIPDVDLVIFYSPLPSIIRTVQRRGRTGRTSLGKVLMLITKGTRDEAYYWAARKSEEALNLAIKDMQNNVKQLTLENYPSRTMDEVTLFVDSRESELAELLHSKGANAHLGALKVGDFVLAEDIGCERKTVEDFVNSLVDGRLFDQAKRMREAFAKPFMIVEGDISLLPSIRNVAPAALMGALSSLVLDWNIPILITKDKEETADMLMIIARREQNGKKRSLPTRPEQKPQTLTEAQQFFVEGLPQIGPELARNLLKHFGSPKKLVNAPVDELQKVGGIGDKKAEIIRKLLDTEFKD